MPLNESCISETEQWRRRDLITGSDLKFLRWGGKGFVAAAAREKLELVNAAASLHRMVVSDTRLVLYTPGPDDDLFSGFYHSATGGKPAEGEPIYLLEAQIDFIPPTHVLALNTWGGTRYYAVEVIGATKSRTRVRMLQNVTLPGRRQICSGTNVLVPKHAILSSSERRLQQVPYDGHVYGYGDSGVDAKSDAVLEAC